MPPNDSHRKIVRPITDSANSTIVMILVTEGLPVSIYLTGSWGSKGASALAAPPTTALAVLDAVLATLCLLASYF